MHTAFQFLSSFRNNSLFTHEYSTNIPVNQNLSWDPYSECAVYTSGPKTRITPAYPVCLNRENVKYGMRIYIWKIQREYAVQMAM